MENNKKNTALIRACCNAVIPGAEGYEMIVCPASDIYETSDAFIVEIDMPGASKESISVTADARILSVSSLQMINDSGSGEIMVNEIGKKKYYREFRLGTGIKLDDIRAEYKDGVLLITLPKADELKARQIRIQ
jgi:HSP20 family protein